MAVSWVSKVSGRDTGGASTTLTLASVVGSGGDLVMAFFPWRRNAEVMTGATYGGAAMTQLPGMPYSADEIGIDGFYKLAPAGTQNVVGTWGTAPARMYGHAHVLSGVDQGTPFGTAGQQTGTGTQMSAALAVTTVVGGMVIDVIMVRNDGTLSPDSEQTKRSEEEVIGTENSAVSTEPADATTESVFWTWPNSEQYRIVAIPINPVLNPSPASGVLSLAGTGIVLARAILMPDEL